ncbi:MAG TPA: hypothetical protein VK568_16995 [Thermodesulfobacteriota bacterium]|jgi:hypothetical protein|nr:hypothetical protein [Thermodesulfobacteriota bacterium]
MELKEWRNPIIGTIISGLVVWALKEFSEITMKHVISFIITFSPVIIGLIVFLIYLSIKLLRKSYKFKHGEYASLHEWLTNNRHTNYPHLSEESLEGKIVSMLEWWDWRKRQVQ